METVSRLKQGEGVSCGAILCLLTFLQTSTSILAPTTRLESDANAPPCSPPGELEPSRAASKRTERHEAPQYTCTGRIYQQLPGSTLRKTWNSF